MKVEIAECSGFCFGVKRAIGIAQQALLKNKTSQVYSIGHIIHNSQVVEELAKEGLRSVRDLSGIDEGVVVISSHGASPEVFDEIKSKGLGLVDATCPYVMSAQKIVSSLAQEGYLILIFGDRDHPEVKSLVGFAKGKAIVIKDADELKKVALPLKKVGLVSQTTQLMENYTKVISEVLKREPLEFRVFNTICNDTKKRQESAAKLAKDSDVMIIVGGKISANTRRLFEICSGICGLTHHIETAAELKKEWFRDKESVGIASGASTPDWIINEIRKGI
jgi:4-hydroxy-3-methylbut-2-enyl diphosphate reductase